MIIFMRTTFGLLDLPVHLYDSPGQVWLLIMLSLQSMHLWGKQPLAVPSAGDALSVSLVQDFAERARVTRLDSCDINQEYKSSSSEAKGSICILKTVIS